VKERVIEPALASARSHLDADRHLSGRHRQLCCGAGRVLVARLDRGAAAV